jgi:hypothetical protein
MFCNVTALVGLYVTGKYKDKSMQHIGIKVQSSGFRADPITAVSVDLVSDDGAELVAGCRVQGTGRGLGHSTLDTPPHTLNLQHSTLNTLHSSLNTQHSEGLEGSWTRARQSESISSATMARSSSRVSFMWKKSGVRSTLRRSSSTPACKVSAVLSHHLSLKV